MWEANVGSEDQDIENFETYVVMQSGWKDNEGRQGF